MHSKLSQQKVRLHSLFYLPNELGISLPQLPPLISFQQLRSDPPDHLHGLVGPLPEGVQPQELAGRGGREGAWWWVWQVGGQVVADRLHFGDEVGDDGVELWLQTGLKHEPLFSVTYVRTCM